MAAVLMAVWFCKVHLVGSIGVLAMFLLAVCTSVFYGVLMWTIYVALEPYVRKHWPQVLVSWTNLLAGRWRTRWSVATCCSARRLVWAGSSWCSSSIAGPEKTS
jgi:hypothetical protein